jgi:hypothetical protein
MAVLVWEREIESWKAVRPRDTLLIAWLVPFDFSAEFLINSTTPSPLPQTTPVKYMGLITIYFL